MTERPYSRYTRSRTWAALFSQHLSAGFALVPFSATNNSIDVIRCDSTEEAQRVHHQLLQHAEACEVYYLRKETPDHAPVVLTEAIRSKRLRRAVVLARSSDYYHYRIDDRPDFRLVICGLHDSYLLIPCWETSTNRRYRPRETAVQMTDPGFDRIRRTQVGHTILLAAYAKGDPTAIEVVNRLPPRTKNRYKRERDALQANHYQGRPLAFLTEAERREIGAKISAGLRRYYERRRAGFQKGGC